MKRIYSILLLISLLLAGTSCEDDYRDMVFFTGEAPIYQIGTCGNLISSVDLYLTKPDGIVVGVDGGSGTYVIVNGDETIVTANFTTSENGYERVLISPKAEGETIVTVRDSEGNQAMLRVWVDECVKYVLKKTREGIVIKGDATEEQKNEVAAAFTDMFTVKVEGRYELIPDDESDPWRQGTLRVYLDAKATTPMTGRYEYVPVMDGEQGQMVMRFTYNNEEHNYRFGTIPEPTRMSSSYASLDLWEEVTEICPIDVPEDCKVYHVERVYFE